MGRLKLSFGCKGPLWSWRPRRLRDGFGTLVFGFLRRDDERIAVDLENVFPLDEEMGLHLLVS